MIHRYILPDSDVLNARIFLSNLRNGMLQSVGESFRFGFESLPTIRVLPMASPIYVLPVIINDQIADIDVVSFQDVHCV